MKIAPFDSPVRFMVQSDSEPEIEHLVDLLENRTFGKCSCQHFEFRIQPAIDAGSPIAAVSRCKHLTAVREAFLGEILKRLNDAATQTK